MTDTQIFQLFAVAYLTLGFGFLLNPKVYKKIYEDIVKSAGVLFLTGILTVVVGYLLVSTHNTWTADWSTVITVFGWIALIKGAFILVCPQSTEKMGKFFMKDDYMPFYGVIVLLLGAFCGYLGWWA